MDRGYMDFQRLHLIAQAGAFFLSQEPRTTWNMPGNDPRLWTCGRVSAAKIGKPKLPKARTDFPSLLRKVRDHDEETERDLVFSPPT